MKLLLAVSVIVVALFVMAGPTSASEDSSSVKDHFESFGSSVREFATKVGEKTKTAFEKLHKSEFATKTRDWFSDAFKNVKEKFTPSS
ncbi:apolipoprotein C-I-like [Spea bombifrons]|uniref:apolipoprotein C-I-like n=1 Tax=Spea bombifrons TaxID=233779 RepID=UPI00234BA316|nr:apolipoprotein C-I-like [Spea bombifrons]